MKNTDYVKAASFIFLKKNREMTGNDPTETVFNNYMILLNRALLTEGIDIGLPHYWFTAGDEVLMSAIPYIHRNCGDVGSTMVTFDGGRPEFDPHDRVISLADRFAEEFIKKYAGTEGQMDVANDIYNYAPFNFQNDFRRLMGALMGPWGNDCIEGPPHDIAGLFNILMESFPSEFGYLSAHFERFASTFSLALSTNVGQEGLLEVAETFWTFFCHHLRLESLCHHNIPPSTLTSWKEMLPEEEGQYTMFVQNQAAEYCPPGGCIDPVIEGLLRDRDVRLRESDSLFRKVFCRNESKARPETNLFYIPYN